MLSSVVKGEGDDGSGRGAIAGCHCKLLWLGGRVDMVPLLGAIVVCYGWGVAYFLYIDNTKSWFCYLGSMLV